MAKKSVERITTEIAIPVVEEYNCELVDVEYKKEGANWFLRLYIDKPGGVSIGDCQKVSERVSNLLDKEDPIPHNYYLEVSSVGIDRPLKKDEDFERFKGHSVDIKLYRAIDGSKNYTGRLMGLVNGEIHINSKEKILKFKQDEVAMVRLSVEF